MKKISNILLSLLFIILFPTNVYGKRKVGNKVIVGKTTFVIWGGKKTGIMPKGASISPNGKFLFVSNFGRRRNQNISVFKADPMTFVRNINYKGNSIEAIVSKDNNTLYSTNMYGHYLDIIDLKTYKIKKKVKIKGFPKIVILSPKSKYVYLSLWSGRGIARVNLSTYNVKKVKTFKKNPRGLAFSKDGKKLYIANNGSRSFSILNIDSITKPKINIKHIKTGRGPRHVVTSKDGKRLYVSVMGYNAVLIYDTATLKLIKRVTVGSRPKTIEESFDGKFVYVANYLGHSMSIIDTKTFESKELHLDIIKASGLAVHPTDKYIYVTGWCTDDMWAVLRVNPGETIPTKMGKGFRRRVCRKCKIDFMGCERIYPKKSKKPHKIKKSNKTKKSK
jgi:YVTN family beta-propeller protein